MKQFLIQIFSDKNSLFSLREVVIALLVLALLASWVGVQFFGKPVPEHIFYSFTSLVAAGTFGYSIERKCSNNQNS